METKTFIGNCLGVYNGTSKKIDEICDNFDIDMCDCDVYSALDCCEGDYIRLGNLLIFNLYEKIIEKVQDMYPEHKTTIEELIAYDVNDFGSSISFNGENVHTLDELTSAIENLITPKENEEESEESDKKA